MKGNSSLMKALSNSKITNEELVKTLSKLIMNDQSSI